ncbi:CPBP family intramembrane glutamic endopeptidase [Ralstonia chuxiongensis]|uniref:CPBP family intramembrane metalloprotease n=1 Tax=Ralstonia chuxiongensis TaxID=2957504 RepID=A0AA42BJW9_9RALS|nr:CPBP family intramembrane glutamic endopeptidase [Ralstonia chuxiongensis]MCP1175696.1 CPBP family intramembrane metalloprotease [Ralstonia chuxiongensis]
MISINMLPLVLIIAAVCLVTSAAWALWRYPTRLVAASADSPQRFIQRQVRYQIAFGALAVIVVVLAHQLSNSERTREFSLGALASSVQMEAFGLPHVDGVSWLHGGCLLTFGFGLATLAFVFSSLRNIQNWPVFIGKFGVWVIAISAINALSEELIYRGAIISVARGVWEPSQVALLSAVLFALAHVRGQASGFTVVIGSAVVGWCFAIATMQTHGLFLAWCAHFVQDVVIFLSFLGAKADAAHRHDTARSSDLVA